MQAIPESLESWLNDFSKAVREQDFTAGRKLFDEDVTSFGTVCFHAGNLDELATHQWQLVWPKTADFNFNHATARAAVDGNLATVVAEWTSTGFDGTQKSFPRRGRATIVLKQFPHGWKAIHTHFSIGPASSDSHDPLFRHPRASSSPP
jgi:ketosteroid isomerase-like protein